MNEKFKNEKIIKCSICRRFLGRGKLKTDIVCILCYKRKGIQILGARSLELKEKFEKLAEHEEIPNFLYI